MTVAENDNRKHSNGWIDQQDQQHLTDLGLPARLAGLGYLYQVISTLVTLFMFLQMLLILVLDTAGSLMITRFLHCYGPRILAHHSMTENFMPIFSLVVTFNHLAWRTLMVYIEGRFELNLIPFMLAKEETLSERTRSGSLRLNARGGGGSTRLDILDRSLFYKFECFITDRTVFKLRPNRNAESKRQMIEKIHLTFLVILLMAFMMGIVLVPLCIHSGFGKQTMVYKDCRTTVSWWGYGYRIVILTLVNLIFFVDQVMYVFVICTCGYLFAHDLMIYWNEIWLKVDWLYHRLIQIRDDRHSSNSACVNPEFCVNSLRLGQAEKHDPKLSDASMSEQMETPTTPAATSISMMDLSRDIVEVQCLLADFFSQLSLVDRFMSVLVPVSLGTWLTCNIAVTVTGMQAHLNTDTQGILIRFFQAVIICLGAGVSLLVLKLKRRTEPLYPILCNIVAMDRRINTKQWLRLLDIYTGRPRYAFTVWHGPIFTQATCIRFLSYTLTLEVLLGSHRNF